MEDIEKEYQRFLDYGAAEHEKPTNVGDELMVSTVKNSWGNLVRLIYNPHFKLED